jgi:putative membrane-bound dehydrogenase-like protein
MFTPDDNSGHPIWWRGVVTGLIWLGSAIGAMAADQYPALSPQEALRSFRLEAGLRIELVAAEPLVIDPVAFVFDDANRLFVAEGRGYPDPVTGGGRTTEGRIVLLEDSDGDGRFERRKEFAAGLGYVNGLLWWRGGVFVTAAPDILYLKDNDGDGVADENKVVLTGFDQTKTAQLRVSHPTLGFDGKVYVTSGINGGKVTSPFHPERAPVTFSLRDGRFDPDTFEFENTSGRGQFGLTFDAFGRRFICSNRHPVLQVMLEPWHLSRNPHLGFSESTQEVSKVEAEARVNPLSRATLSADFIPRLMGTPHTGTFTAASGVTVFGGTGLQPEHVGNVFICESAQNLVQRQVLRPEGASFRSDPATPNTEFLASTDVWFRPVFLGHGPDGALYVADMYRREIDHPRYVPEESRGGLDFESGKDRGRIYRIVRDGARTPRSKGAAKNEALTDIVAGLESADEWWRQRAYRVLIERADSAAVPLVEKVARASPLPESRARALWTLRGLRGLSVAVLKVALHDPHPGVREQAAQLAADFLQDAGANKRNDRNELLGAVIALTGDPDPRVRFCVALTLAGVADPVVIPALAAIAQRDGEDRWTRAAVLSGIGGRMEVFLAALQSGTGGNAKALAAVMEQLGRIFGAGASASAAREFLQQMLTGKGELSWRMASVLGLVEGFQSRGPAGGGPSAKVLGALLGEEPGATELIRAFLRSVAERSIDPAVPARERMFAVGLLAYSDFEFAGGTLAKLLDTRQPPEVQLQAVRALERIGDPRGGRTLITKENWGRYTPQVREAVLASLTARPALIAVLFEAIRAGVIAAPEISSVRRTQLLKHADPTVQEQAKTVFKELEGGDRMQVYRTFRETLNEKADLARGREAFVKVCSACHTHKGLGGKVGPDLTGIRNQPADAILLHVLVPNYEVAPNYQTLSVVTQDGRSFSGWLAAESEGSVTLRTTTGNEETVPRKNITSLTASGISLMPDGLEQTMAKEDVTNLIAFLKSDR